jgi:BMFP domain-containing protein YqiC
MIDLDEKKVVARITNYLSSGGLFNPELMEHNKVRNLLMDARETIQDLEQRVRLLEADFYG